MKTDAAPTPEQRADDTPLARLLEREHRPSSSMPERIDGIVLGRLVDLAPDGSPIVALPQFGLAAITARAMQAFDRAHIGRELALGFEGGRPDRPIVFGAIFVPSVADAGADAECDRPIVRREHGRTIVEAEGELELRCGQAVIRLDASGRIDIRGGYINTHASATQRIRGGSVQIN